MIEIDNDIPIHANKLDGQKDFTIKQLIEIRNRQINKGKYIGVERHKSKYRVRIGGHYGNRVTIGYFKTSIEAAKAYDKYMFEKYGEPLALNFPDDWNNG